jgi:hypothetical protein
MTTVPSDLVSNEEHTEVVHETEDGLVEVGAVSETKGNPWGNKGDGGIGLLVF